MKHVLVLLFLPGLLTAPLSYCCAQEQIVAIGAYGEGAGLAICDNGDCLFGSFTGGVLTWSLGTNIFESAGVEQLGEIVGVDSHYWIGVEPLAIDSAGNVYSMELSHGTWSHQGLLADLAGHEPSGVFIGLASAESGIRLVAITDLGESYMHTTNGLWVYSGNALEDAGIVSASPVTLGDVKSKFR